VGRQPQGRDCQGSILLEKNANGSDFRETKLGKIQQRLIYITDPTVALGNLFSQWLGYVILF
jgi:hypothetical protein